MFKVKTKDHFESILHLFDTFLIKKTGRCGSTKCHTVMQKEPLETKPQ